MTARHTLISLVALSTLIAIPVVADWNLGDVHKMHYPQLPDPLGWDVNVSDYTLADDWRCEGGGPVQQIHFWISWTNDYVGTITNIHLSIHDNIPPDPQPPFNYSRPGPLLWEDDFVEGEFAIRLWEVSQQGWYDPVSNIARWPDHTFTWQVNVKADPTYMFEQIPFTIYWLDIKLDVTNGLAGWKNTWTNFMDDAVVWFDDFKMWEPLTYPPQYTETLDLSFVIDPTPEPLVSLPIFVLLMLARRR